ncbi:LytTR family DNA-binding domain-containing protein [Sphingomonas psychrotolerans]|nr:LytTR family DNA-binding domain-containing protein [Sphingomonas psychrotolerans]
MSGPGVQLNPFAAGHPAEPVVAKLLVWACVFVITCGCRQPLHDLLVARRRSPLLLLVALAFGPVIIADVVGSQFAIAASGYPTCAPGAVPLPPFFSFLPRTVILGTTMLLVLLAWSRHLANRSAAETVEAAPAPAPAPEWPVAPPATPGEWLELPEAPLLRVRAADVDLIRSAGNYSEIVTAGRIYLVRVTLTELADRFAPLGYIRIHRQTIVNAHRVRAVHPEPGGRAVVHLYCGISLPVGGRYVDALRALH